MKIMNPKLEVQKETEETVLVDYLSRWNLDQVPRHKARKLLRRADDRDPWLEAINCLSGHPLATAKLIPSGRIGTLRPSKLCYVALSQQTKTPAVCK